MGRTILFRGKSISTGQWIESTTISQGTIKRKSRDWFFEIGEGRWSGVINETIGQYIGLTDKNFKKIFEGDLINMGDGDIVEVKYRNGGFGWISYLDKKTFIGFAGHTYFDKIIPLIEVVGNIHDVK